MADNYLIIDKTVAKAELCNLFNDCSACPFYNSEKHCSKLKDKFLKSISVKEIENKKIDKDTICTLAKQIFQDTHNVAKRDFEKIYDDVKDGIKKIRDDENNEFSMARVYIVGKSGIKLPVGTFKYETVKDQIRCVDIARDYAKHFGMTYLIEPIRRKDCE